MISDEKFEEARKFLHLDDAYSLLHETTKEHIDGIVEKGLELDKSYNAQITRVVSIPKNEDEFKNYNYYTDKLKKTILVFSIPKSILGDVSINSTYATLILNCIAEYEKEDSNGFNNLRYQRLPSRISNKWINGYFDENNDFVVNPKFIMAQENSEELIKKAKQEIMSEFRSRYLSVYKELYESKGNDSYSLDPYSRNYNDYDDEER